MTDHFLKVKKDPEFVNSKPGCQEKTHTWNSLV